MEENFAPQENCYSPEERRVGGGHPVLGIVLGILGILTALGATFLFGAIGGGIALLLGIIAIAIGVSSRKKCGKGKGAIVTGIIAILLAAALTFTFVSIFKAMHNQAVEANKGADPAPYALVEKYTNKPWLGMWGILSDLAKAGEAEQLEFNEQLNQLSGLISGTVSDAVPAE